MVGICYCGGLLLKHLNRTWNYGYQFVSDTEAIFNSAYKSNYLLITLFLWKQRKVSIVNKTVLYEWAQNRNTTGEK